MLWMLPLVAALFWFLTYRRSMALPPLWSVRAMSMQGTTIAVFIPTVVGAAAWMGSREARRGLTDLLAGTARPRWARQLATWAATTGWAMVAYLGCVGVLYGVTAPQVSWGGPLWWPAAVGAASLPASAALGFAAGALRPSRFTPPLVAVAAFLALEISVQFIHGAGSYWQISPLVAGFWELGTNEGLATFYPYLPDLAIAQLIFLAGLTAALLGVLGLPAGSGGRWLRRIRGRRHRGRPAGGRDRRRAGRHRPARRPRHDRHPRPARRGQRPADPLHPGLQPDRDPGLPAPRLRRLPVAGGGRPRTGARRGGGPARRAGAHQPGRDRLPTS